MLQTIFRNITIQVGNKIISNAHNSNHLLYEIINRISVDEAIKDTYQQCEGTFQDTKDPDIHSEFNTGFLQRQEIYSSDDPRSSRHH